MTLILEHRLSSYYSDATGLCIPDRSHGESSGSESDLCVFRKDLGGLFEFSYYCLQHQQECKYDCTTLYYNEPEKFIHTIFKCFKCYCCIRGPYCVLNGRVLH